MRITYKRLHKGRRLRKTRLFKTRLSKTRRSTRRNTRRHTKNCKRYRKHGGNYDQFTDKTVEGSAVSSGTMVTIPGMPVISLEQYRNHVASKPDQGPDSTS